MEGSQEGILLPEVWYDEPTMRRRQLMAEVALSGRSTLRGVLRISVVSRY